MSDKVSRPPMPRALQVAVFRRDGWLCYWCKQPVIFAPTMRLLELELRKSGFEGNIAYHHPGWARAGAPLLDQLGATIDHKEASSIGGAGSLDNLATACWKCNVRKNAKTLEIWDARLKSEAS
jgi:5-methylcytosine-specific restriction endonuclease McrA